MMVMLLLHWHQSVTPQDEHNLLLECSLYNGQLIAWAAIESAILSLIGEVNAD